MKPSSRRPLALRRERLRDLATSQLTTVIGGGALGQSISGAGNTAPQSASTIAGTTSLITLDQL